MALIPFDAERTAAALYELCVALRVATGEPPDWSEARVAIERLQHLLPAEPHLADCDWATRKLLGYLAALVGKFQRRRHGSISVELRRELLLYEEQLHIIAGRDQHPPAGSTELPILSQAASIAYEVLLDQPPHRGLTGPELLLLMDERGCPSDQSTLTSRIVPELKPYGIENAPRKGYRIPPSKRPPRNAADAR